jgi:hypothetical protein
MVPATLPDRAEECWPMGYVFLKRAEMELTKLTKWATGWVLSVLSVRALGIPERLKADSSLSSA